MNRDSYQSEGDFLISLSASLDSLSTREKAKELAKLSERLRDLSRKKIYPDLRAGRARILRYFQDNVGVMIDSEELAVVSGIVDYQRRIRELRVEHGWPILTGQNIQEALAQEVSDGLEGELVLPGSIRPDQYMLLENVQDSGSADRWRMANSIRRETMGTRERLLKFFRQNVGIELNVDELKYVARSSANWQRRIRELRTEGGWPIVTRLSGDPTMRVGTYKLAEDRQLAQHDRRIPEAVRREVLKRDQWKCQWRGCGWPGGGFPATDHRYLEVHHVVHHAQGGSNSADNLVTLCNLHHDEVHRTGLLDLV